MIMMIYILFLIYKCADNGDDDMEGEFDLFNLTYHYVKWAYEKEKENNSTAKLHSTNHHTTMIANIVATMHTLCLVL